MLLGMITPSAGWNGCRPTRSSRKPEREGSHHLRLLGYPLMQAADIVVYRAHSMCRWVRIRCRISKSRERLPAALITFTVKQPGFGGKAAAAVKLGGKLGKQYDAMKTAYNQDGNARRWRKPRHWSRRRGRCRTPKRTFSSVPDRGPQDHLPEPQAC